MKCSYAEQVHGRDDLVKCGAISAIIGWGHGVHIGICERCEHEISGASPQSETVCKSAILLLKNRVARHWDWDDILERRRPLRDDIEGSLRVLRDRAGVDVVADALVEAVRRGMPRDRARGIAERVLSEKAKD